MRNWVVPPAGARARRRAAPGGARPVLRCVREATGPSARIKGPRARAKHCDARMVHGVARHKRFAASRVTWSIHPKRCSGDTGAFTASRQNASDRHAACTEAQARGAHLLCALHAAAARVVFILLLHLPLFLAAQLLLHVNVGYRHLLA